MRPPAPLEPNLRARWLLKEEIAFLNHGSFGAVPREVLKVQDEWRRRIEAEPVEILGRRCDELIDQIKQPIGQFLGMSPANFGLVTNATEGINAVLQSLSLSPGDELLTTTHVYNAVRQAMRRTAAFSHATYREIDVPLAVLSGQQIAERILSALSPRTRLLVIDHVTSPTALVFPVETIIRACAQRDIDVLVDGAHAPGMIDLNVESLGAAYYAGNLHKWVCAPKGSAFIYVRPDRKSAIHPCVVSHNFGQGFAREFAWQGTRDISNWLSIPFAIDFMSQLGWERVRQYNHSLACWGHALLCERWAVDPISPLDGALIGSMATMRLPGSLASLTENTWRPAQQSLYSDYGIESPLMSWGEQSYIRISAQVYNDSDEYLRLAAAIESMSLRQW